MNSCLIHTFDPQFFHIRIASRYSNIDYLPTRTELYECCVCGAAFERMIVCDRVCMR